METTRDILLTLQDTLYKQYCEQLSVMPIKKALKEALQDGFRDGCRSGIYHTVQMLGVTIKE